MQKQSIPHKSLVLVGDGRKALFLRNVGSEQVPEFIVERRIQHGDAATRDLGTAKPGRAVVGPGTARSAMDEVDWRRLEEARFVHGIADLLSEAVQVEAGIQIAIVLPPRALGELRAAMNPTLKRHVVAQIQGDLTAHTISEIERHLAMPREPEDFRIGQN